MLNLAISGEANIYKELLGGADLIDLLVVLDCSDRAPCFAISQLIDKLHTIVLV